MTLLREFRGDGHIACLVSEGLGPREALSLHIGSGEAPPGLIQATRGWSDDQWSETADAMKASGLLAEDGTLTAAGAQLRQAIEDRTDKLALAPWEHLGQDGCDRLRALVRPWSKTIVATGSLFASVPAG